MKFIFRLETLSMIVAGMSILGSARGQTVVWSENFDDGNGNNRWYADTGVWQVGSPTIGPATNSAGYRTHSGPDCATTGLTANYPSGMNSRLIRIQTFTVPAASQFPRLRFWHWFSFGAYSFAGATYPDYGVVEIRIGTTGTWQAVSPQYTGFCGDWSYASVDLSAFAGQTIDVAFHVVSNGGSTAPGWFVDDISVITGIPVFNNPEGFEAGIGDWYAEQGTWQVGSPAKTAGAPTNLLGSQTYVGTNCAVTLLTAAYPDGLNSRLISPFFVVPPASSAPFLRFWHWYSFGAYSFAGATYPDYGVVEIKVGTNAWQVLSPQYTGNAGAYWTEPFIDLTSFGGQTVQFAFHVVNRGGSTSSGWFVDDVQIYPYTVSPANPYINAKLDSSGTNVVMNWTWLPEYTGYTLQSISTNITTNPGSWDPTNWNPIVPVPKVINGQNVLTNPASGAQQYFRLQAN